jgi:hypothetical protein
VKPIASAVVGVDTDSTRHIPGFATASFENTGAEVGRCVGLKIRAADAVILYACGVAAQVMGALPYGGCTSHSIGHMNAGTGMPGHRG